MAVVVLQGLCLSGRRRLLAVARRPLGGGATAASKRFNSPRRPASSQGVKDGGDVSKRGLPRGWWCVEEMVCGDK